MTKLTLGPILFNWDLAKKKAFYKEIATKSPIDVVYLGEVVCSKRTPFFEPYLDEIIAELQDYGKEVVYSTQALLLSNKELDYLKKTLTQRSNMLVEANDISGVGLLQGRPHCLGPYINVYNEPTLSYHVRQGAVRITLAPELPKASIMALGKDKSVDLELQVFGRLPLAISARCSHARAYGLQKHNCEYICGKDNDGMEVFTLDKQPFLTVNGLQTLSHTYANLLTELTELKGIGITHFRLSPHDTDMVEVAKIFKDRLEEQDTAANANARLSALLPNVTFANGFYHHGSGHQYITA